MNFYIFKNNEYYPFVLILVESNNEKEEKNALEKCEFIYKILFDNKIISLEIILVFLILKNFNKKKLMFYQEGIESNNDILKLINEKSIEHLCFNIIKSFSSKYIINFNNKILIEEQKENLSFLCYHWIQNLSK